MALLKYFKRDDPKAVLPSHEGSLSHEMHFLQGYSLQTQECMEPLLTQEKESRSRDKYEFFTEEEKAETTHLFSRKFNRNRARTKRKGSGIGNYKYSAVNPNCRTCTILHFYP